jgi:UDP-N-acetylglucosamine 2-epimerase
MNNILKAVEKFDVKALVFYPNVDANNSKILSDISKFKPNKNFFIIRHMPLEGFVHAMSHARCMIGNSSAGIREIASFGVPAVNIGDRQVGRERNSNVIDTSSEYDSIVSAIKEGMSKSYDKLNLYYTPNGSKKIVQEIIKFIDK